MTKGKKVTLFCGKGDCCPTIIINRQEVIITDDFGGKAKLTIEQFAVLKKKIKKGLI